MDKQYLERLDALMCAFEHSSKLIENMTALILKVNDRGGLTDDEVIEARGFITGINTIKYYCKKYKKITGI